MDSSADNCASDDESTLFDDTVVGDVHQVVDFYVIVDRGVSKRSSIYTRVSADLDVVAYPHPTKVGYADRNSVLIAFEAKTRRPNA